MGGIIIFDFFELIIDLYIFMRFWDYAQVIIGGWKNSKSVIRKNRTKPDVTEVSTPDFLTSSEQRGFWVRYTFSGCYIIEEYICRSRT